MGNYLFDQLRFARSGTIRILDKVDETSSMIIPEHFNNNVKWNLGHIYLVQERFAFHFSDEEEKMQLPEEFLKLFAPGTKPAEWEIKPPSLDELKEMLEGQVDRIESVLKDRLHEEAKPYTTSSGLTISTVGAYLTFTFFHEGMHLNTMKHILKAL